jgi:hypothetical protein
MRIFRVGLVGGFTLAVALVLSEIAGHCSEGRNAKKGRRRADEPMHVLTDRSPAHNGCDFRWSLHHLRRDLTLMEVRDGTNVGCRAERVVGSVGGW